MQASTQQLNLHQMGMPVTLGISICYYCGLDSHRTGVFNSDGGYRRFLAGFVPGTNILNKQQNLIGMTSVYFWRCNVGHSSMAETEDRLGKTRWTF